MSIWGKKVDDWFDRKTGASGLSSQDRERNAIRMVLIVALLVVVAGVATYASR